MLDGLATVATDQCVPLVRWRVQTRGPCNTVRTVAEFGSREEAAEHAQALRTRGLVAEIAWTRG